MTDSQHPKLHNQFQVPTSLLPSDVFFVLRVLFFLFANKRTRGKDTAGHDKACFPYLSFDTAVCLRSLSVRDKAVLLGLYFHESGAYTKSKQRLS